MTDTKDYKTLSQLSEDSKMLEFLIESLLVGGVFLYQTDETEFKASAGTVSSFHSGYGSTPRKALEDLVAKIQSHNKVKTYRNS